MQKIDNNNIKQIKRFLTYQKTAVLMLGVIVAIMVLFLLKQAQSVFVPFTIAWVLSRLLTPIMMFLKKHKVPTGLSVVILLLGMTIMFSIIGTIVTLSTTSFTDDFQKYVNKISTTVPEMSAAVSKRFPQFASSQVQSEINQQIIDLSKWALNFAKNIFTTISGVVSTAAMILIMLAFMLISAANSKAKIDAAFSSELSAKINNIIDSISSRLSKYLYIQTMISLTTGILVGVACKLFGISSPLTWGFLTFILNYIPIVGSIIASIPPIIIALITYYPNWWPIIGITLVILGIQQILGNIVAPKLMGENLDISPVMILFGLLLFTWMWGIVGAWLSVMIVATIRIVCGNIAPLKPIGVLLSQGRSIDHKEE
ncbi:MAG: AI-2E family transporter [Kiritimatiellae bacterium]|jgi:AI-2 transport protein TqsA|nr:AI-2E family transporter [Kiritimatiellia bacterium]